MIILSLEDQFCFLYLLSLFLYNKPKIILLLLRIGEKEGLDIEGDKKFIILPNFEFTYFFLLIFRNILGVYTCTLLIYFYVFDTLKLCKVMFRYFYIIECYF